MLAPVVCVVATVVRVRVWSGSGLGLGLGFAPVVCVVATVVAIVDRARYIIDTPKLDGLLLVHGVLCAGRGEG